MAGSTAPDPTLVDAEMSQPLYKPPAGGDLVLRSSDGTEFPVHSIVLKLASSVFDGMLIGTTKDKVELTEDAATVSLMLRFIYPNKTPTMTSIDMLSECLNMAQKYDIGSAIENLDDQVAANNAPYHLVSSNPIRAYQLAVQFGLHNAMAVAAPLVTPDLLDFCDPKNYSELTQKYPSSSLFRIIGLQGARAKILSDVLFDFNKVPILPSSDDFYYELSCSSCRRWADTSSRKALFKRVPTSWLLAWTRLAYQTLLGMPLEKSDFLFDSAVLMKFGNTSHVCQTCLSGFYESLHRRESFVLWVKGVKVVLAERLEGLKRLYAL